MLKSRQEYKQRQTNVAETLQHHSDRYSTVTRPLLDRYSSIHRGRYGRYDRYMLHTPQTPLLAASQGLLSVNR